MTFSNQTEQTETGQGQRAPCADLPFEVLEGCAGCAECAEAGFCRMMETDAD